MVSRALFTTALLAAVLAGGPSLASADDAPKACAGVDLVAKARANAPADYAGFEKTARDVPNAEGLLWRIERKTRENGSGGAPDGGSRSGATPSYLFGTMHTTDPDLVALSEPVRTAIARSKTVAVELADAKGAKSQAELIAYVTANALDLGGGGLDGLTTEQRAEVGRRLAETGLPASLAASLKPWFLGITLQVTPCETKRIADGRPTVDFAVEDAGKAAGATIVGLETVTEQLDAVSKIPEETARRMIRDTVETANSGDDLQATTLQLYRDRRVGWYLAMKGGALGAALDVGAYADFMEQIVDRRNRLMADRSKALIEQGGAFVAVGALHLPGPKGLVELYRQAGFEVTKVW